MECAQRTEADKKGGHLANGAQGLLLRESAQVSSSSHVSSQSLGTTAAAGERGGCCCG